MKIAKYLLLFVFFIFSLTTIVADEGMWIPSELQNNYPEMQKLGLKLTLEQLYDLKTPSIKDAVVRIDGCTAEFISSEGLLLTNHHCGYGNIQSLSSVEHDYLTDGFWAMSKDKELPCPGKPASILIKIEKVTDKVLEGITNETPETDRTKIITDNIKKIEAAAKTDPTYRGQVSAIFGNNDYYLYVYQTFRDVRLVGAPPSSIGKFGGDTDNWMWPRHTGDFSIFRVYCAPDGSPADYSKDNIPYKPKNYLRVSLKGYNESDFAMIWGFPGTTDRYLTSFGIQQKIDQLNPVSVKLKYKKMEIMKESMDKSDKIRIQYAAKYFGISNFWKKSDEERKALIKLKVADNKRELESQFNTWANSSPELAAKYGKIVSEFESLYKERIETKYPLCAAYTNELSFSRGCELITFAGRFADLTDSLKDGKKVSSAYIETAKLRAVTFYKDYNVDIDKKIFISLGEMFYKDLPKELHPEIFSVIQSKFGGSFSNYADYMFEKSVFTTPEKFNAFISNPTLNTLTDDPAYQTIKSLLDKAGAVREKYSSNNTRFLIAKRNFLAGLREMNPDYAYYPDANSTMRVTYGKVLPYDPRDAVKYKYYTTLKGIMEKEDPNNEEFIVPSKLKSLFESKDYGQYGMGDEMPVAFLTDNDITGGNSGSPVLNANGELIGVAFDGNSEAMSGDIHFDKILQRTIVCDIRYVLFIIDKFAGATNLIEEMTLVK